MNDYSLSGPSVNHKRAYRTAMEAAWQQRQHPPTPTTHTPATVRYCRFHDEAGYAVLDGQRRVFYVDHDAQFVLLTNADIAALVLLGHVATADAQRVDDALRGGYAAIACQRTMQEV